MPKIDPSFIGENAKAELRRQMWMMSVGIDALEGLYHLLPGSDEEQQVTSEQLSSILKCIEFSLLSTQRKIVKIIND
tara:strand:+ start:103109 stop:103339 length:231 start_codon:yes stop_codon:yes gene_type:complete